MSKKIPLLLAVALTLLACSSSDEQTPSSSEQTLSSSSGDSSSSSSNLNSSSGINKCGSNPQPYNPDLYECKPEINPNGIYLKQKPRDSQGNEYKAVLIGNQTWMAENLNYDGGDGSVGRCYEDNNDNCNTYGRLYILNEVECPSGWHLPSKEEWLELLNFVSNAGTKLKASSGWNGDGNGTDDYGFAALPGGYCGNSCPIENSPFSDIGTRSFWWSASVSAPAPLSITFSMSSGISVGVFQSNANSRFYARCISD